jgi:hypothetical protein
MFLVLIFTRGRVEPTAIVRSEGDMTLKNPVTPPGIDPGTVRLVAQRLNHYATPGPYIVGVVSLFLKMNSLRTPETSEIYHPETQRHMIEDLNEPSA